MNEVIYIEPFIYDRINEYWIEKLWAGREVKRGEGERHTHRGE